MTSRAGRLWVLAVVAVLAWSGAQGQSRDVDRDILVTFENEGARSIGGGFGAPYTNRKRYAVSTNARRNAAAIAKQYALVAIADWPLDSLAVYCLVYRVPLPLDRDALIEALRQDSRVESVQALQTFDSSMSVASEYDDTYAGLQHGLAVMAIAAAHEHSRGKGVRVAIIDSHADADHEDLVGRVSRMAVFAEANATPDPRHGTAVASVIGARTNNAKGIVGIAPEADLELFVSCWAEASATGAVCDTFTLANALDTLLKDPPHVLNLSLTGPQDPLLQRLLLKVHEAGVIVIAARSADPKPSNRFPASLEYVIAVGSSVRHHPASAAARDGGGQKIFAPGDQIMVAVPNDGYDFRSGSSLAAAHVSGVVALLKSLAPELTSAAVAGLLRRSQGAGDADPISVNACQALQLIDRYRSCSVTSAEKGRSKLQPGA